MEMKDSTATTSKIFVMSQEDFFIWFLVDTKAKSNFRSDGPMSNMLKQILISKLIFFSKFFNMNFDWLNEVYTMTR